MTSSPLHVRGVVLPDDSVRDLWLFRDTVTLSPVPGAVTVASSGFVLPGLVDAHCHIGIRAGGGPVSSLPEARDLALVDRAAGVLALRDAGSPFPYPSLDSDVSVPRLARAGQHIAAPRRYLRDTGVEVAPTDVVSEVRRQASLGNGWVKLVGDWIDRSAGDLAPSFPLSVLSAAVAAAHEAGVRIAAHVFAESSVATLVRAGVDSVEHGTGLSFDDLDLMAARGIALVPTLLNVETFPSIAEQGAAKFPAYAAHMRALHARFPSVVRAAHEAGVPVYVGTDAGGGIEHGLAAREIMLLHSRGGLSPVDALAAGSWKAREWLGFPGLVEGGLADLVVYEQDPRKGLETLLTPKVVVLRGRVVS